MAGSNRFGAIAVAMANPQFRLYTVASIPSLLGTWIQRLAVAWLAWKLTESHAWVGAELGYAIGFLAGGGVAYLIAEVAVPGSEPWWIVGVGCAVRIVLGGGLWRRCGLDGPGGDCAARHLL